MVKAFNAIRPLILVPFVAAVVLAMPQGAQSQPFQGQASQRPTAEQIIAALKPTGVIQAGTRGIRPLGPTTAPVEAANAAAPVRPVAGQASAKVPSIDLTVLFEFGSAELTVDASRTLDELGRALTSAVLSGYRFRIEGHTDTVGTPEFNKSLSDQRAAVVARYLEARFGLSSARLETVGLGDSALLVPTPPQTPEQRNRRVHVVNLGA